MRRIAATLSAAAVAGLSAATLGATAAHAEGHSNHLWTTLRGTSTVASEGKFPTPTSSSRRFQVIDRQGGDGLAPWVNIRVPDGRTFEFRGADGGTVTYVKGYDISQWRLCDSKAGYCTAWVNAPRP